MVQKEPGAKISGGQVAALGAVFGIILAVLTALTTYVVPSRAEYTSHVHEEEKRAIKVTGTIEIMQKDIDRTHRSLRQLRAYQRTDSENLRKLLENLKIKPAAPPDVPIDVEEATEGDP